MVFAWIFGLAILTLLFNDRFQQVQRNPNKEVGGNFHKNGVEVVLHMNYQGHYLASGKINTYPVEFLVDTGATWIAVPGAIAQTMNLQPGMAIETQTANGNTTAYLTKLKSVELGAIQLNNVKATIVPNMTGNEVLLGMSFLRELDLLQSNDKLILRQNY